MKKALLLLCLTILGLTAQAQQPRLVGMTSQGGSGGGNIFDVGTDGTNFQEKFPFVDKGQNTTSNLLQGTDGKLYGMTQRGGSSGFGVIFRTNIDGTGYTILQNFNITNGANPSGSLIQGTDGKLYGMTRGGGSFSLYGVIFSINMDGTGYTILHNFNNTNGANPWGSLIQGIDGRLYGMTTYGGTSVIGGTPGYGVIFSINPNGTGYTILHNFNLTSGAYSFGSLIQGTDGKLYGATSYGGTSVTGSSSGAGVIFSINMDGTGYTILHNFNGTNGANPSGSLTQGTDGKLYGVTSSGGSSNQGIIFSTNTDGSGYAILHNFNSNNSYSPQGSLIQGTDGKLYGMTTYGGTPVTGSSSGAGVIFSINMDGTGYTILHNFNITNGANPSGSLTQGTDGKLYGVTYYGGSSNRGVIFSTNTDGTGYTILQNFDSTNGANPYGSLIQGTDGKLYGMTYYGGSSDNGVIFSTNTDGTSYTILQNFSQTNGANPWGSLIQGTDGKLYGMTQNGDSSGYGVIFSINPNGTGYTVLQNFNQTNGANPYGPLIQGTDGKLYGMTTYGGTSAVGGSSGYGVIFSINPNGTGYTILQNFNLTNGAEPWGSLIQGIDGKLYGMTQNGGSSAVGGSSGYGVIFSINPNGTGYTVLQNFNLTNGNSPLGSLIQGTDGKLYGMTTYGGTSAVGGSSGYGVIFSINPNGTGYTILQNFNLTNGAEPYGSLIQGTDGKLFGMTNYGGNLYRGVIFYINTNGTGYTILQNFNGTNGTNPRGSLLLINSTSNNCPTLSLSPANPPLGTVGTPYNTVLTASGGKSPYQITALTGNFPPGLEYQPSGPTTGTILGTPTQPGSYSFTAAVADSSGCSTTQNFTIVINPNNGGNLLPSGTVGVSYSYPFNTPNTNYTLSQGSLPSGLYLEGTYGVIFGNPNVSGAFTFSLTATSASGQQTTQSYSLNIACPNLDITTSLPNGSVGTGYNQTLSSTGGSGSYLYGIGSGVLPDGLYLEGSQGVIYGNPSKTGSFTFSIFTIDTKGCRAIKLYTVNIGCPNFVINTDLPNSEVNGGYLQNLSSTGGSGSVLYSVSSGSLPSGLYLDGTYGAIYGNATQAGSFPFTITATDSKGCQTSKSYNLTIAPSAGRLAKGKSEAFNEKPLTIYPNPTQDKFSIQINEKETVQVVIFDIFGRKVYQQTHKPDENLILSCQVETLASGTYFVKVSSPSQTQILKLAKN